MGIIFFPHIFRLGRTPPSPSPSPLPPRIPPHALVRGVVVCLRVPLGVPPLAASPHRQPHVSVCRDARLAGFAFTLLRQRTQRWFTGLSGLYSDDEIEEMPWHQKQLARNFWGAVPSPAQNMTSAARRADCFASFGFALTRSVAIAPIARLVLSAIDVRTTRLCLFALGLAGDSAGELAAALTVGVLSFPMGVLSQFVPLYHILHDIFKVDTEVAHSAETGPLRPRGYPTCPL